MRLLSAIIVCTLGFGLNACNANRPLNPSFPLTTKQARVAWKEMKAEPKPFSRPVLVLSGIYDPGFVAHHIADELRDAAADRAHVIPLSFFNFDTFERSAQRVVNRVEEAHRSESPDQTVEVDVVAFSMGGLVARQAASFDAAQAQRRKRLNIARLFTIASPHQGACLAWIPTFDSRVIDMRPDSQFLAQLNLEQPGYELHAYTRLGDWIVGTANASPPTRHAWWVAPGVSFSHVFAGFDDRILADIARRLRGEAPYATEPPAPLP